MIAQSNENFSDDFKKIVASEAYLNTPRGGYSELAVKYNLQVDLVYEWVKIFFPRPPTPFSAQHIWMGISTKSEADFSRYFRYVDDYFTKVEAGTKLSAKDTGCVFCIDLDSEYLYDEDLLFYLYSADLKPSEALIQELPLSTVKCRDVILIASSNLGIKTANAIFSYADPTQIVEDKSKLYNELIYLGLFQDS